MRRNYFLFIVVGLFMMGSLQATTVSLPKPDVTNHLSLNQAIQNRRSIREFSSRSLTSREISQLTWAGQGITDAKHGFRAVPSAGALYPLDLFLVKSNGVWHYLPRQHALRLVNKKDLRARLSAAAYNQSFVKQAPLDIVIIGTFNRLTRKYGSRAKLFTYTESGHAAQNILLEATALYLAATPVGGFSDHAVSHVLDLNHTQTPLYIIAIGHPTS